MIHIDIQKYLNRIHAGRKETLSLEYLSSLQEQHALNIHFENLDILNKRPLFLDREGLFKKMVLLKRGGVCYELNGLFYYLLKELGFHPYLMTGTVFVKDDIWGIENGHLFMIVPLNRKNYIVDVGLGARCLRVPVPLGGEEVIDFDGYYRVKKDEEKQLLYLQKKTSVEWSILYRFQSDRNIRELEDIYPICRLTETSPQSIFTKKYFLSKELKNGRMTLLGNTLTIVNGKDIIKRNLVEHEIYECVRQFF